MPQTDPVADRLRATPMPDVMRATAWDAYMEAKDADDLAARLQKIPIPQSVKADLWDLKQSTITPSAPTPAPAAPAYEQGGLLDAFGRGVAGFWEQVNPVTAVKAAAKVVTDLPGAAAGVLDAQRVPFEKAKESFSQGDYISGARHALNYLIPLVGPMLDEQGDKAAAGNIAGSVGGTLGIAANIAGPKKVLDAVRAPIPKVPAIAANRNPVEAAAVQFGQREGIPIDVATATGNRGLRAVQHVADRSVAGGAVAEAARVAQGNALAATGERLATRAHGTAQTAEQAGHGTTQAVKGQISKLHGEANTAYQRLRAYEADPAYATRVPVKDAPPAKVVPITSSPVKMPPSEVAQFDRLFADAKAQGYAGTRDELARVYTAKLKEAKDVISEVALSADEATGHLDLLKAISKAGGIGIDLERGGGLSGELAGMIDKSSRSRTGKKLSPYFNAKSGGVDGAPGVVVRKGGMTADAMREHLSQDPRFAGRFENLSDFIEAVDEAMRVEQGVTQAGKGVTYSVPTVMRDLLGVTEGNQWWGDVGSAPPRPTTPMGLAVDLRPARSALKPLADRFTAMKEIGIPLQGAQARAALALKGIMDGPDYAPLSVVDEALGELKSMARSQSDLPELRNHAISQAIEGLDLSVKIRAAEAGDHVLEALEAGRKATRAKYAAADVLDELTGGSAEGVRPYDRLTAPKDSRVGLLRKIQQLAPNEVPKVARAYLDRLLEKAMAEGGFGKAKGLAADWQRLGPETKKALFRDPAYIQDLDNFFILAKRIEDTPNPSGTAHTLLTWGQGGLLVADPVTGFATQLSLGAISKLMHSKAGVKLLTQGFRLPVKAKAAAMALRANLLKNGLELPDLLPAAAQDESPEPVGAR